MSIPPCRRSCGPEGSGRTSRSEIDMVESPASRVPNQGQLLGPLPAERGKGPLPIGSPAGLSIRSRQTVARSSPTSAGGRTTRNRLRQPAKRAEDDPDRLAEGADASNHGAVDVRGGVREICPVGEDEVLRVDSHPVAPVGVGADVVGEREGRLLDTQLAETSPAEAYRSEAERALEHQLRYLDHLAEIEHAGMRTLRHRGSFPCHMDEGSAEAWRLRQPALPAPERDEETAASAANARATSPPRSR